MKQIYRSIFASIIQFLKYKSFEKIHITSSLLYLYYMYICSSYNLVAMNKYTTNKDESEILPNLLGLLTAEDIAASEFEGFLYAEFSRR